MAVRDVVQAAAGIGGDKLYVEDVFSTYLYTGNGSTQTITNNIDLAGEGGLVWIKARNDARSHQLSDTAQGVGWYLASNTTNPAYNDTNRLASFNSDGYSLGEDLYNGDWNYSGTAYTSWTFRKAPKFFDVVTYTGTGSAQNIAHSLGITVGAMFIKRTDVSSSWVVWHRAFSGSEYTDFANPAIAKTTDSTKLNGTVPTSDVFTVGTSSDTNASGGTYVAYLFAHDTDPDGVIQCGSYVSTGSNEVSLGWEPQFIAMRRTNASADWEVMDTMRGLSRTGLKYIEWNNSDIEATVTGDYLPLSATGYTDKFYSAGQDVIYIAIRRGPMKTPESGTEVFSPLVVNNSAGTVNTTGFPVDLQIFKDNRAGTGDNKVIDRLRGVNTTTTETTQPALVTNSTAAEDSAALSRYWDNTGFQTATSVSNSNLAVWNFRRAPGFFDVVCYTGTGSVLNVSHNLGVTPELIISKCRNTAVGWITYHKDLGNTGGMYLNNSNGNYGPVSWWNSTSPTASQFTHGASTGNYSGEPVVTYLFASCPGVSKVGSYTGTGTTNQINCGFTGGARFVLIKRTDSTGDWYVWDSARGIVSGNDPYLLLNSTAAEVTSTDYVDTYSAGFEISSTAPAAINASGGSFIYLAIA